MNAFGLLLVWVAVQVSLFCLVGSGLYAVVRRRSPAAGGWAAGAVLVMTVGLSSLALAPWPRWGALDSADATWPTVADTEERESATDERPEVHASARPMSPPVDRPTGADVQDTVATDARPELRRGWKSALTRFRRDVNRASADLSRPQWGWPAWVAVTILVGCGLALFRLSVAVWAAYRYRMLSRVLSEPSIVQELEAIRGKARCARCIVLRESPSMCSPCTIGWLRPAIILPADWRSWNARALRAVLAHEMAHVARCDFVVWLVAQFAVVLHFYNPLVLWLARRLRLEQEMAADVWGAKLLGSRQLYLTTLAQMALRRNDPPLAWAAHPFLPTRGTLMRRVELLHHRKNLPSLAVSRAKRAAVAATLLMVACFLAGFRPRGTMIGAVAAPPAAESVATEPTAIFVMKVDGSGLRRLAEIDGYQSHGAPRWSQNGKWLTFAAGRDSPVADRWFLVDSRGTWLSEAGPGAHVDWSPDDKQLVFAVGEEVPLKNGIWVQNLDGRGRRRLADGRAPRWSPDGSAIAMTHGKALAILDLIELEQRTLLEIPSGIMNGFDWSPDGKQLAFVTQGDGQQELWIVDVAEADVKKKLLSGSLGGYVAWSPDGQRLAVALARQIHLLDVHRGTALQPIPGQEGDNRMPAWSADGQWIAFASDRKKPARANVAQAKRTLRLEEVKRHTRGNTVFSIALSPDGKWALLGGDSSQRNLQIWNMINGESRNLDFHGEAVALSPDGRTLASCGTIVKIELGDVENGESTRDLHSGGMCTNVEFSPDGGRLVSGSINKQAVVWNVASGKRICVFKKHEKPITRVAFLPSGEEAASNGQDKMLRVWNARTAEERLAIAHPDAVWGLAVSPDGRLIATGTGGTTVGNPIIQRIARGTDNSLRLWDAETGNLVREMKVDGKVVYDIDFSPDGRTLVSGDWDGAIQLWDVDSGRQLASVQGQGSVYAVAFTHDGSGVLVGGGSTRFANTRVTAIRDEQVRLYRIVEANAATQTIPQ